MNRNVHCFSVFLIFFIVDDFVVAVSVVIVVIWFSVGAIFLFFPTLSYLGLPLFLVARVFPSFGFGASSCRQEDFSLSLLLLSLWLLMLSAVLMFFWGSFEDRT